MAGVQHKILILSGKARRPPAPPYLDMPPHPPVRPSPPPPVDMQGGVGKSTVSTQLAHALAMRDHQAPAPRAPVGRTVPHHHPRLRAGGEPQVGLLDIDICGPSVPRIMGLKGRASPPPACCPNQGPSPLSPPPPLPCEGLLRGLALFLSLFCGTGRGDGAEEQSWVVSRLRGGASPWMACIDDCGTGVAWGALPPPPHPSLCLGLSPIGMHVPQPTHGASCPPPTPLVEF
jgi:hypothetical protein